MSNFTFFFPTFYEAVYVNSIGSEGFQKDDLFFFNHSIVGVSQSTFLKRPPFPASLLKLNKNKTSLKNLVKKNEKSLSSSALSFA